MLGVGQKLPEFKITGVKPGFNSHEENGVSAFEAISRAAVRRCMSVVSGFRRHLAGPAATVKAEPAI